MGRIKINDELKKKTISIALDEKIFDYLDELNIKSKSKLINWLLKEHLSSMVGIVRAEGESYENL